MSRPLHLAFACGLVAYGAIACGNDPGAAGNSSTGTGATGAGGAGGTRNGPSALEFVEMDALELRPRQEQTLRVRTTPPGVHLVRFSLTGESADGSLTRTEITSGADGLVETVLVAPSQPTTFSVRASVGTSVSAALPVSVGELGLAELAVTPVYEGKRTLQQWIASVHPGKACAELVGNPPPDGTAVTTASPSEVLDVTGVEAGGVGAVVVRSAQLAGGCSDVALTAGAVQEVTVQIIDRPIQLKETDLDLRLGVEPSEAWTAAAVAALEQLEDALTGPSGSDASALLDAMDASLELPAAAAFSDARSLFDWDGKLVAMSPSSNERWIRDYVAGWVDDESASLVGPSVLKGRLLKAGNTPGFGSWRLQSVAGLEPETVSWPRDVLVTWSAQPDDTLELGVEIFWLPSRLVAGLADRGARSEVPGAADVPAALAELLSCNDLSATLTLGGTVTAFDDCDSTCFKDLCVAGLERLWGEARDASTGTVANLAINAAGDAQLDTSARPTGLTGTWVGTLDVGLDTNLTVSGPAHGIPPEEPAPE